MKKQTLLFTCIIFSVFTNAQSNASFGVRAGISSAGMRGEAVKSLNDVLGFTNGIVTTNNHIGFFAGMYASIPAGNTVSVEPALYYSQKGYALNGTLSLKGVEFLSATAKAELNMQYIDMPVLIKLNFSGFQVFAGPQISYLLQADLHATAGALGFNVLNSKMNVAQQFNKWDAAATAGLGYQFTNGINVIVSYDYGLTKADAGRSVKGYNTAVKAGIGFSF